MARVILDITPVKDKEAPTAKALADLIENEVKARQKVLVQEHYNVLKLRNDQYEMLMRGSGLDPNEEAKNYRIYATKVNAMEVEVEDAA
jgi:hypothetical protein